MPADNLPEGDLCFLTQVECNPDVTHNALHIIGAPVPLVVKRDLRPFTWSQHQLQYEEGCALLLHVLVCSESERLRLCQLPSVVLRTSHATIDRLTVFSYFSYSSSFYCLTSWASLSRLTVLS
jgi:hypothetical protein